MAWWAGHLLGVGPCPDSSQYTAQDTYGFTCLPYCGVKAVILHLLLAHTHIKATLERRKVSLHTGAQVYTGSTDHCTGYRTDNRRPHGGRPYPIGEVYGCHVSAVSQTPRVNVKM
eukprot:4441363-Prymnesium_polylepis.1